MVYDYKFLNPETNEEFIITDCEELTLKQATKMAHEKGLLFIGCSTRTERRVMSKKFFFDKFQRFKRRKVLQVNNPSRVFKYNLF